MRITDLESNAIRDFIKLAQMLEDRRNLRLIRAWDKEWASQAIDKCRQAVSVIALAKSGAELDKLSDDLSVFFDSQCFNVKGYRAKVIDIYCAAQNWLSGAAGGWSTDHNSGDL
jgi:hypothetical protein